MEEINILEIIKYFKKKIIIIAISALTFLVLGIIYTAYIQKPMYKSQTTLLLLKANEGINNTYTQSDVLMNQNLVSTYSEIIKSKKVLNRVIKELDLNISLNKLTSMISISTPKDSILIAITVTSLDKKEAMEIANETAKIFLEEIQNLLNMQNVGIVDEAILAKDAYNVSPAKQIVLATVVGILLSISVLLIIYYFDTTVKTEDQIEKQIGLPVIGVIPEKKRSSKWKKN